MMMVDEITGKNSEKTGTGKSKMAASKL